MSKTSSRTCPDCKSKVPVGKQYCPECLFNFGYWQATGRRYKEGQRTSLRLDSTYTKKYMLDDKKWDEDIKSRKKLPDGSIGKFKKTRSGEVRVA